MPKDNDAVQIAEDNDIIDLNTSQSSDYSTPEAESERESERESESDLAEEFF